MKYPLILKRKPIDSNIFHKIPIKFFHSSKEVYPKKKQIILKKTNIFTSFEIF
jgi:hypothetical protein